jgi:hypothetical protein
MGLIKRPLFLTLWFCCDGDGELNSRGLSLVEFCPGALGEKFEEVVAGLMPPWEKRDLERSLMFWAREAFL